MKTVRDLISDLLKENPDSFVFLSIDPEGNAFEPFSGVISTAICENGEITNHTETKWSPNEPQDPNAALILWP